MSRYIRFVIQRARSGGPSRLITDQSANAADRQSPGRAGLLRPRRSGVTGCLPKGFFARHGAPAQRQIRNASTVSSSGTRQFRLSGTRTYKQVLSVDGTGKAPSSIHQDYWQLVKHCGEGSERVCRRSRQMARVPLSEGLPTGSSGTGYRAPSWLGRSLLHDRCQSCPV